MVVVHEAGHTGVLPSCSGDGLVGEAGVVEIHPCNRQVRLDKATIPEDAFLVE